MHIFDVFLKNAHRKAVTRRVIALLSIAVLLLTVNSTKLTADTLERVPTCGIEEHTHTDVCFDAEGNLVCGMQAHAHTDACFQQRPNSAVLPVAEQVEAPVSEQTVELGDVTDDSFPSAQESPSEEITVELNGDEMPVESAEPLFAAAEDQLLYYVGDQQTFFLSDVLKAVKPELTLREVSEVGEVLDAEDAPQVLSIERIEEDYAISPLRSFEDLELAIVAGDAIFTVRLIEADVAGEDDAADDAEETSAEEENIPAEEDTEPEEEAVASIGDEIVPEDAVNTDDPDEPAEEQEDVSADEGTGADEETADDGENAPAEDEEPTDDGETVVAGNEESTDDGETAPAENEDPTDDGEADAVEDEEPADDGEADAVEDDEESADDAEDASSGDEAADAKDASSEDEANDVEETALPDEESEPVEDEEIAVEAEQPVATAARYAVTVDLSGVETYPISLNGLLAQATAEEQPENVAPAEERPEDAGIISAPEEVSVELDAAPETVPTLDYDAELLSIVPTEDDYALTALKRFDAATVIYTSGDIYKITLLNGERTVEYPAQSFAASTDHVTVNVEATEGAFPAGTTMTVTDVDDADTLSGILDKAEEGFVRVERVHAVDITFLNAEGAEIEPLVPISVTLSAKEAGTAGETMVVHIDHAGAAQVVEDIAAVMTAGEEIEAETSTPAVAFTADAFSVYALVMGEKLETKVIDASGDTYHIEVSYTEDAQIPAGARLEVAEVTDDDAYRAQVEAGLPGNKMITLARFFDIRIMNGEEEVQPKADVRVKVWMENTDTPAKAADDGITAIEAPVEEIEAELGGEDDAEEALVVEYEQPGAEIVSTEEAMSAAVASVPNTDNHAIVTSDPVPSAMHFVEREDELVVVERTVEQSDASVVFSADGFSVWGVVYTVDFYYGNYEYHLDGEGEILLSRLFELLGIEKNASDAENVSFTDDALLRVERVAFENGQDWLLTSLRPFDTEETLTVVMNDGEVFVIDVTDAQALSTLDNLDPLRGYLIYTEKDNQYYVLKNDLTTTIVDKSDAALENLGPEYLWRFEYRYNRDQSRFYITRTFGLNQTYTMRMWNGRWAIDDESRISWDNHVGLWENPNDHKLVIWGEGTPETRLWIENGAIRSNTRGSQYVSWFNLWEQDRRYFTVGVDDPRAGGVIVGDSETDIVTQAVSHSKGSASNFRNDEKITAVANNTYAFDHWELNGQALSPTEYPAVLEADKLPIPYFGSELKPVFKRVQTQHYTNYPPLDNPDPQDIAQWIGDVLSANPLGGVDKTAEVYDYENRIYRVDLKANSGFQAVASDLALAFMTDISNSMLFPEAVYEVKDGNGNNLTMVSRDHTKDRSIGAQIDDKVRAGLMSTDNVYITIGDIAQSSTQYAIFYAGGGSWEQQDDGSWMEGQLINGSFFEKGWWGLDASYYAKWRAGVITYEAIKSGKRWKQLKSSYFFANNEKGKDDYVYTIYEPNSNWFDSLANSDSLYGGAWGSNRLYYLIQSVQLALDQIQRVESRYRMGAVFAGLETFAGSTSTDNETILKETLGTPNDADWNYRSQDFVQIGGATNYQGGSYEDNKDAIINKLNNITTHDGTAQDIATQRLKNILHWDVAERGNSTKKYVIMITDGAPNRQKVGNDGKPVRKPVQEIIDAINAEKNTGGSLDGVTLITIGLGINDVPGGQQLLHEVASPNSEGNPLYYSARDGVDLMYILMDIVRSLMEEAAVSGDVVDEVDDAFYPVNKSTGLPLKLNDQGKAYISLAGDELSRKPSSGPYGVVSYDSNSGKYTVKWENQDFQPEALGGWHGTLYLKVKEDFLGGNTISTNGDASMTPKTYHRIDGQGNKLGTDIEIPNDGRRDPVPLETPHVNVDELALTENSTEWTVIVDTGVSPRKELQALYSAILVEEVVDKTKDMSHVINDGHTSYTIVPNSDADNTTTVNGRETFPLTTISGMGVEDIDWDKLIQEGKLEDIEYNKYGHDAGKFTIELIRETVEGEHTLEDDDNGVHTANVVGEKREQYTLKVTYRPNDYDLTKDYHTGTYGSKKAGNPTDTMTSVNEHVINVFEKALRITKVNEDSTRVLTGAEFALYRTARTAETSETLNVNGIDGQYHLVDKLVCDEHGIAGRSFTAMDKLALGEQYCLVETKAPLGYNMLTKPIPVTFTISEVYQSVPGGQALDQQPENDAYNWTQSAVLRLETDGISGIKRVDESGTDLTNTGLDATSTVETVYYKIANNPGVSLPSTGGPGTLLYTVTGVLMILGAAVLLVRRQRY